VNNGAVNELMRSVRYFLLNLFMKISTFFSFHLDVYLQEYKEELEAMRLGLAHSLARYKVKFNPEKIDTVHFLILMFTNISCKVGLDQSNASIELQKGHKNGRF
jgi:RNA processing factor Prp31